VLFVCFSHSELKRKRSEAYACEYLWTNPNSTSLCYRLPGHEWAFYINIREMTKEREKTIQKNEPICKYFFLKGWLIGIYSAPEMMNNYTYW